MIQDSFVPVGIKHPYCIVTPPYTRRSAGTQVLHFLCHWLNRAGYPAFINNGFDSTAKFARGDLVTPVWTRESSWQHPTPIVVYPEVIAGNPLAAPIVVRYAMNYPGLLGAGEKVYSPSEMVFTYSQRIANAVKGKVQGLLWLPVVDTSVFYPPEKEEPRSGSCFYAHKFRVLGGTLFGIPPGSIEIINGASGEHPGHAMANVFRHCEKLYVFEDTYLTIEAALCGCPTVAMPNAYWTGQPINFAEYNDGMAGIALGDSEAELRKARATLPAAVQAYKESIVRFWMQLDIFIEATQAHARRGGQPL